MKETGKPIVLTVNGQAEVVVQDAVSYQKVLVQGADYVLSLPCTRTEKIDQ